VKLTKETMADLVDGAMPRAAIRAIQSGQKDAGRFDVYLEVLQDRVPWDDPIVLPFGEHLAIVAKGGGRYVVKCRCGHEFCSYEENWKLESLVAIRDTVESLREIYPDMMQGDPEWSILREYFCPGCSALLEVEAVPPGYPVIHDFLPDLHGFYEDWLKRPLPDPR
jgi:acetone carboxylase gamma subunit